MSQPEKIAEVVEEGLKLLVPDMAGALCTDLAKYAASVSDQMSGKEGSALHRGMEAIIENVLYPHIAKLLGDIHHKEQAHLPGGENGAGQKENFDLVMINGILAPIVQHLQIINKARAGDRVDLTESNYRRAAKDAGFLHEEIFRGSPERREEGRMKLYQPIAKALFEHLGLKSYEDLLSLPPALRKNAWEQLQKLRPTLIGGMLESALDHDMLLTSLISGLQNFNASLAQPEGGLPKAPSTQAEAELDGKCGDLLREVVQMIPLPMGLDKFFSAEDVGKVLATSVGAALRKQLDGEYITGLLQKTLQSEFDLTKKTPEQRAKESAAKEKLLRQELRKTVDLIVPKLAPSIGNALNSHADAWVKAKLGKPGQVIKKVLGWFIGALFSVLNVLTFGLVKKGMRSAFERCARSYLYKYSGNVLETLEKIVKGPLPKNTSNTAAGSPRTGPKPAQAFSDVHLNGLLHALHAGAKVFVAPIPSKVDLAS